MLVTFDTSHIEIRAREPDGADWRHSARWEEVVRVCFARGGAAGPDIVSLTLRDRTDTLFVPMNLPGAHELLSELSLRGLLPDATWREEVGETSGAVHCWPPMQMNF